jgi:anti-sigma regulatory factor (Ser/Thr protein kinase)
MLGGAFFVSHSAILGYSVTGIGQGLNFWWRVGWLPVVISPPAWYVGMLWYAGYWDRANGPSPLRWQRPWLIAMLLLAIGLMGLLVFANPLPSYTQLIQLRLSATPELGGIPLLILIYPLYIVLCITLSLVTLRHPGPSARVMGDLARRRARPWLIAASLTLLVVSLLVAWVMAWVILSTRQRTLLHYNEMILTVAWFDLTIDLLIALAVILMGRAIVSYEVFTGKTLPRRGFFRHWRSAVILAAGYGVVVGWTVAIQLRPIYSLLLTTVLMVVFYALFSWRSFVERDRYINLLRPFVASQRLYDYLLDPAAPADPEIADPFKALCADVLGAQVAYLVPLGALAPLVGSALSYPDHAPPLPYSPAPLLTALSPQTMCLPLDPTQYGGAVWAVPLWSERGLVGVLLLGEKRDGGLYTQEEIEIARASGERLIDTQASIELARRLMTLQRQRLAQTQVLDRQTRRVLHDDILPSLHAAMLMLSNDRRSIRQAQDEPPTADRRSTTDDRRPETGDDLLTSFANLQSSISIPSVQPPTPNPQPPTPNPHSPISLLADIHRQISDLLREMPPATAPEMARLGLIEALRRVVEHELPNAFDEVVWEIEPEAEQKVGAIPDLTTEVLFYAAREAIRNAARHGRAEVARSLQLIIALNWPDGLELIIQDNGVGLAAIGRSSGENLRADPGQGRGLALHSTMMAVVGGTLAVESAPGVYTRVTLSLPSEGSYEEMGIGKKA